MVKDHKSWPYPQNSAWQLPDLNCMSSSLEPGQPECLPTFINPSTCLFPENMSLPGFAVPGLARLKTEQNNGAHVLLKTFPSHFQTLVPNALPYLKEQHSALTCGFAREAMPNAMVGSLQKGLLVFDQSGNETRLIYNSVFPSVLSPPAAARKPDSVYGLPEEAVKIGQFNPVKAIPCEESDKNHIYVEESEMHEDTEEINALLYSDDDDDYSDDDDDDDDDEVMSTDHSPIAIEGSCKKRERIETITEEIDSSDGPDKRQKLLDGGYNKSSEVFTACSVKWERSNEYDNDAESGYANGQTQREEVGSFWGKEGSRKDKIRKTLRILESIIPGVKGKDPLLVLNEAIDYLQSLKLKAKILGV